MNTQSLTQGIKIIHPQGSTVRVEKSGHAGGVEAWWIWVEGLKNVSSCHLNFAP